MSLILCLSSGLPPLLGLFLCLPRLCLILVLLAPYPLICFPLCPAPLLMTKTYPHAPLSLQKSSPLLFLLHQPHVVPFLQGNLGEDILLGENPQGDTILEENPQEAEGGALITLSGYSSHSSSGSHTFPLPILHLCFPRDTCLEMEHWIYLLDLGSVVTYLRILQLTPSSFITPVLPKSFLPQFSSVNPLSMCSTCFLLSIPTTFSLVRTTDSNWSLLINSEFFYSIYLHFFVC